MHHYLAVWIDCQDIRHAVPSHLTVDSLGLRSGQRRRVLKGRKPGICGCVCGCVCICACVHNQEPYRSRCSCLLSGWVCLRPPIYLFMSRIRSIISDNLHALRAHCHEDLSRVCMCANVKAEWPLHFVKQGLEMYSCLRQGRNRLYEIYIHKTNQFSVPHV